MKVYDIMLSGGPVMWPLLLCSIVVITVIVERLLFWLQIRKNRNRPLLDEILHIAGSGNWQQIKDKTKGCEDHIIRVLSAGIQHRGCDMSRAMEAEAQSMVKKMSRFMSILDTMITVAPLLGIFGTVLGIISSFKMLGIGGIADPKLVTCGIAQALITTAAGLAISIGTVFPYNFYKSKIELAVYLMEKYATSLEMVFNTLQVDHKKEDLD